MIQRSVAQIRVPIPGNIWKSSTSVYLVNALLSTYLCANGCFLRYTVIVCSELCHCHQILIRYRATLTKWVDPYFANVCSKIVMLGVYAGIDECSMNNGGCAENAICVNLIGSYFCYCDLGYAGNAKIHCDGTVCLFHVYVRYLQRFMSIIRFSHCIPIRQQHSRCCQITVASGTRNLF